MGAIGLHAKFNHALIDRKVKLVDLFKTMELLNNRYAFYAFYVLGRGSVSSMLFYEAISLILSQVSDVPATLAVGITLGETETVFTDLDNASDVIPFAQDPGRCR